MPFILLGELPGERWLSARDSRAPAFAALGALLLVLDVLLPVPSSAVGVMLGARLGFPLGFACCLLGVLLGHSLGYALGRLAPQRWAAPTPPSAPSMLGVFVTRPVPVLAEALAVTAGVTRMRLGPFMLSAAFGDAIYAAALSAAGARWLPSGSYIAALVVPMLERIALKSPRPDRLTALRASPVVDLGLFGQARDFALQERAKSTEGLDDFHPLHAAYTYERRGGVSCRGDSAR